MTYDDYRDELAACTARLDQVKALSQDLARSPRAADPFERLRNTVEGLEVDAELCELEDDLQRLGETGVS